ncbi:MAG: leucine-rich repeat protein [bacterium]|nr:leucine-rich repeat protein [bacterium]
MKRKILIMMTIGSVLLMALAGCGDSSESRLTSDWATSLDWGRNEEQGRSDDSEAETTGAENEAEHTDGLEAEMDGDKEADRLDDSEAEMTEETESEEESGTEIEIPVGGEPGLYQSDGSFIPWDDLGIDVETNYTYDNYNTKEKSPCKVFTDNNYDGYLVFPDDITKIGNQAFYRCTSLTGIDLSNIQITKIGDLAFCACESLTSVDLGNTQITSIGESAFGECHSLTSINLPDTLTRIKRDAFVDCESLKSIDLSHTQITSIEYQAFLDAALESIDLPDSLTSIGYDAFAYTSLTSIDLPDSLDSIDYYAFAGAPLTNINYAGTMREWENIDKAEEWYTSLFTDPVLQTITCSDGVITL